PVAAAVYSLTRRAMDGVRALLESIAWAVYGGFAHLVTAADRHRARAVLHEILALRLGAACVCGAVVLAVNEPFVPLLFGPENFGGIWLTAGFAAQMIVGGQTFLANYLFRAAGRVREGSILLAAEAMARVGAVLAGLTIAGLAGAPWMAVGVTSVALVVTLRRLERELPPSGTPPGRPTAGGWLAPYLVFMFGLTIAIMRVPASWAWFISTAAAVMAFGAAVFWWLLPRSVVEGSLMRWLRT
ncbi:MAG: hypothetical protein H0W18_10560, partial [Acidobacteria bacterium]|nr:hypothetical protein [Acidobacteriota bacterium]